MISWRRPIEFKVPSLPEYLYPNVGYGTLNRIFLRAEGTHLEGHVKCESSGLAQRREMTNGINDRNSL